MDVEIESNSPSDIEFVFFDLGNILFSFDPNRACGNVADRLGLEASDVYAAVYGSGLQTDFESGHIRQGVFLQKLRGSLGIAEEQLSDTDLLDALSNMFDPIDTMLEVLGKLRMQGVPIGVLSNTCRSHWNWINRMPAGKYLKQLDAYVLSFEVGAMKPDPAIYEAAEQAAEVAVERILFLDDRQENVDAASSRGWRSHCCVGGVDAELILAGYGLGEG
jgi:HAD superfamily hydrolase (TIGR01509 family)